MNEFIELRSIIQLVLRRWWLIILGGIIAGGLGYLLSTLQTPVYQATTTLIVGRSIQSTAADVNYWSDIQTGQQLAVLYADIARRQPVLQGVRDALLLTMPWQQLREMVRVEPLQNTQLLEVRVEASDAKQAQLIADEVAQQLLLQSPTNTEASANVEAMQFARERMKALRKKIEDGQKRMEVLESSLIASTSDASARDLQDEILVLDGMVTRWESNYAQLINSTQRRDAVNDLTIIEPAQTPGTPIRPRVQINTIVAAVLGISAALGLIFLLEFLNSKIRTPEEVLRVTQLPLLGVIGMLQGRNLKELFLPNQRGASAVSEGYRFLRSKLLFAQPQNDGLTLLVTSPERSDGKSVLVANLATVFAEAGYRTIVVDANLRQPAQHTIFQLQNQGGLARLLQMREGDYTFQLQSTLVPNLQVLTSGTLPANPSELLSSQRMKQILLALKTKADVILCDAPEALTVADATILSHLVDGVLVVIKAKQTHTETTKQLLANLQAAHANLVGTILNQFTAKDGVWRVAQNPKVKITPLTEQGESTENTAKVLFTTSTQNS